jgi:hypothetical protein
VIKVVVVREEMEISRRWEAELEMEMREQVVRMDKVQMEMREQVGMRDMVEMGEQAYGGDGYEEAGGDEG